MRYIFLIACIIFMLVPALGPAYAGAPADSWQWARTLAGTDADRTSGMAVDRAGNIYVVGTFEKTIRINTITLTNGSFTGMFLAKYSRTGALLWATAATGTGDYRSPAIAVDSIGSIYISGSFSQTAVFGTTTLVSQGPYDVFVAKYTSAGTPVWANRAGGARSDYGLGVAADSMGNCYITGSYREIALFGTIDVVSGGGADVFVAKYNGAGTIQWVRSHGGPTDDIGTGIAVDAGLNLYVTGDFTGDAYFGPFPLRSAGSGTGSDLFVMKVDVNGDVVMAVGAGGENSDHGNAIAIHSSTGNIYVAGSFIGEAAFGGITVQGTGAMDMFVAQFDNSGTSLWVQAGGGEQQDAGLDLAIDAEGNCYVAGTYEGEFTVAKFGDSTLSEKGLGDAFVASYDRTGRFLWARTCGSPAYDEATAIGALYEGGGTPEVTVAGNYGGVLSFDGLMTLGQTGVVDVFLARLNPRSATPVPVLVAGPIPGRFYCPDAPLNIRFTAIGPFTGDNVFTAQLSDSSGSFASPTDVGSVKSDTSGTIAVRIPMTTPGGKGYRIRVVSSSPVIIGGDNGADFTVGSVAKPVITPGGPLTFCEGDSVVLDAGEGYDSYDWSADGAGIAIGRTLVVRKSGVFRVEAGTASGCLGTSDSVRVEVIPLPEKPVITASGMELQSTLADSYQWFFNGAEIPGATARVHTADRAGRYSVRVRNASGCAAISDEMAVAVTGVERNRTRGEISVYPQPTLGEFTLEVKVRQGSEVRLSVRDISGREVLRLREQSASAAYRRSVDLRGEAPGVYFIDVESDGRHWSSEVVRR